MSEKLKQHIVNTVEGYNFVEDKDNTEEFLSPEEFCKAIELKLNESSDLTVMDAIFSVGESYGIDPDDTETLRELLHDTIVSKLYLESVRGRTVIGDIPNVLDDYF